MIVKYFHMLWNKGCSASKFTFAHSFIFMSRNFGSYTFFLLFIQCYKIRKMVTTIFLVKTLFVHMHCICVWAVSIRHVSSICRGREIELRVCICEHFNQVTVWKNGSDKKMGHWITLTQTHTHTHMLALNKHRQFSPGNTKFAKQILIFQGWFQLNCHHEGISVTSFNRSVVIPFGILNGISISFDTKWYDDGAPWLYYLRVLLIGSLHRLYMYEAQFHKENGPNAERKLVMSKEKILCIIFM